MPIRIPERPSYKKERRTVGFLMLAVFSLLFICRLLTPLLPFPLAGWLFSPLIGSLALFLPALFYLLLRGKGYLRLLRLQPPRSAHTPLLIATLFALLSGSFLLSVLCGGTEAFGNSVIAFSEEAPKTVWETLLSVLVCAVLPALLEELLFRGIATVEYERRGAVRAVLMSTLLFALLHFDLANLLSHLFTGALLMLVLYATSSLYATALLHVAFNVLCLLLQRYLNALYYFTGNVSLLLFILVTVLLVSLIVLCRACRRIYRTRDEQGLSEPRRAVPYNVQLYTVLDALTDPAVILSFLVAIAGFILF